jgi:hypothetical protein
MLDSKVFVYNLLKNDAPLVAALGNVNKIVYMYPNDFKALPIVTYKEENAPDADFFDDLPFSQESTIQIDVWANTSTTAISKIVDGIMKNNFFAREFASDVPDPDTKIFHKVLRYRRTLCADDLDTV